MVLEKEHYQGEDFPSHGLGPLIGMRTISVKLPGHDVAQKENLHLKILLYCVCRIKAN